MVSVFKLTSTYLAVLASVANSFPLFARDADSTPVPGVLRLDFEGQQFEGPSLSKRAANFKRDTTYYNETLDFTINTYYVVQVYIGSEHKPVGVVIDTGSYDLIVPPSDADVPGTGWFNPANSTTIKSAGSSDNSFGRYTEYYYDTVGVDGGAFLNSFKFGITAETEQYQIPLLGVAQGSYTTTITAQLKKQGFTNSASFSLFLNSPDASSGQIIFGGIDHEKYEGELVGHYRGDDFSIDLNGFTFADGTNSTYKAGAYLDSGSSNSIYSTPHVNAINKVFQPYANGTVDFKEEWRTQNFTLRFGSQNIDFPYLDLLATNSDGQWELFPFQESGYTSSILGERYLRRLYISANYDTNLISIASARYTDKSNITAI